MPKKLIRLVAQFKDIIETAESAIAEIKKEIIKAEIQLANLSRPQKVIVTSPNPAPEPTENQKPITSSSLQDPEQIKILLSIFEKGGKSGCSASDVAKESGIRTSTLDKWIQQQRKDKNKLLKKSDKGRYVLTPFGIERLNTIKSDLDGQKTP